MFALTWARSEISWLVSPRVMSARISASRDDSPADLPGQSPAPPTLVSWSPVRTTISSLMIRSRASTMTSPVSTLDR